MVVPKTGYYGYYKHAQQKVWAGLGLGLGLGFAHPMHGLRVYCEERACIANLNKQRVQNGKGKEGLIQSISINFVDVATARRGY